MPGYSNNSSGEILMGPPPMKLKPRQIHLHFEDQETDEGKPRLRCIVLDKEKKLPIAAVNLTLTFNSQSDQIRGKLVWMRLDGADDGCQSTDNERPLTIDSKTILLASDVTLAKVTAASGTDTAEKIREIFFGTPENDPTKNTGRGYDMGAKF